tara:strand:- start:222 stop:416 length:195 start_codon:yes stop_codon:yes gene_type:complete
MAIKKRLRIGRLYKGKFPNKEATKITAEAVDELQREVIALEKLLVSKGLITEFELQTMMNFFDR